MNEIIINDQSIKFNTTIESDDSEYTIELIPQNSVCELIINTGTNGSIVSGGGFDPDANNTILGSWTFNPLILFTNGINTSSDGSSANWKTAYDHSQFITGNPHSVTDEELIFSDIVTNNATELKHGFLPKLDGDTSKYLRADGSWVAISLSVGDFLDSVIRMVVDSSFDPTATPTTGDRYIILDAASIHANFGTITGLGDNDIIQYDGADFIISYDSSTATSPATVTIGTDKNGELNHDWTYDINSGEWIDKGGAILHDSLIDLNTGDYMHLTSTEYTNSATAYSHSQVVAGNPHSVTHSETNPIDAGTGVLKGHVTNTAQTIVGEKTFSDNIFITFDKYLESKTSGDLKARLTLFNASGNTFLSNHFNTGTINFQTSSTPNTPITRLSISKDGVIAISNLTASQLLATNASKELVSLAVTTYPSLAELAYVKGVTSSIQMQFTALTKGQTSVASSATPTPVGSKYENEYYLTALAADATFAAPSGTPVNGNTLLIRIQDNGTARTLAWNSIYEAVGVTLPTTTVLSKKMYLGFIYNSTDSVWDCVSVVNES